MTTIARSSHASEPRTPTRLEAVPSAAPLLDRDRAIDAWIGELYQAALRAEGWESFLVSLAEALRLDPVVVVAIANDDPEPRNLATQGTSERSAFARLAPNLRAARGLRSQVMLLRLELEASAQVMDRLPVGVVVVDSRARVVKTNRVADEILGLCDGLGRHDGLTGANATDTAALRHAVASVAANAAGPDARERLCLMRPSGARPWLLEISRVARRAEDATAAATIVISDGTGASEPCADALRTYYGLTPAEADLAALLAAGHSLEQAAARRGVSRNTARGQLKRIFAKTRTNRQAELVRLVLCGPTGLAKNA